MSQFDDLEFTEVEMAPVLAAQIPGKSSTEPASIAQAMRSAFEALMGLIQANKLSPAGPPRAIYKTYGGDGVEFVVALPLAKPPASPIADGSGFVDTLAGTKALRFTHRGSYQGLAATYGQITEFMKAKGLMQTEADWARYMPMWEEYLNDPHTTPEAELLTYIYLPAA
ncbi:MAG: GyrI-like domain-containing protein [Sedimentisphaerales bacterium]|nr:GyrI-like domain-containing protein [Sedimentisphaerales bacterium]